MTDPNVGNTPNDPAPGGSDPGVTLPPSGEGKPPEVKEEEKADELPEGSKTAVIPPREVLDLDAPRATVPATVVTRPGEGPSLPEGASAVLDESDETDMDEGKQDENADKGGSTGSTESGGGGELPPSGGTETAQGGEDPENKAIGQISALLVAIYDKLRSTHPELVKQAERNRSLVRSLLQQCKNKDQLIKMLKLALKTGTTSSLEHLLSTLLKLTTLTDQHINELVSILKDPVFDEAEAYLAAQQADGDVD